MDSRLRRLSRDHTDLGRARYLRARIQSGERSRIPCLCVSPCDKDHNPGFGQSVLLSAYLGCSASRLIAPCPWHSGDLDESLLGCPISAFKCPYCTHTDLDAWMWGIEALSGLWGLRRVSLEAAYLTLDWLRANERPDVVEEFSTFLKQARDVIDQNSTHAIPYSNTIAPVTAVLVRLSLRRLCLGLLNEKPRTVWLVGRSHGEGFVRQTVSRAMIRLLLKSP